MAPGEDGKTDFATLQKSLRGNADNIGMIAFDLLYLNGRDLRQVPLLERKAVLKDLIAKTQIAYSEHFEIDGAELFRRICAGELEGVVSKIANSPYGGVRGNYWVKTTWRTGRRWRSPVSRSRTIALTASMSAGRTPTSCSCRQGRARL